MTGTANATPHEWERVIRTLLVIDLVDSTSLVQRLGDISAAAVFRRHDRIARDLLVQHGGTEIDKSDGFLLLFDRPLEAVLYTLAYHRALRVLSAELGVQVAARSAIHLAEILIARNSSADVERGAKPLEVEGLAKPFTARLMSVGLPGQLLLSTTAFELARRASVGLAAADELRWVHHGAYLFKGVDAPVEVFEVGIVGEAPLRPPPDGEKVHRVEHRVPTPSDPSGLKPKKPPTNLPAAVNPLLGREAEVARLCALLRSPEVRLVTVTGPGGIGKTRLAMEVARSLAPELPQGTFWVPLGSIREPDLLVPAIVSSLGLALPPADSPIQHLKRHLCDRRIMILLDNFEQIVDAAPVVSELIATCPSLRVLVTSRAVLRLTGEHEFAVPPLNVSHVDRDPVDQLRRLPSVALFLQRAAAVGPRREMSDEDIRAVAEICARLDGLPLAIELAASRCKMMAPRKMASKLDKRLGLLTGGARDLPERQRTMQGAIAWSYDLLEDEEKKLFRRLAVFSGGCSFEAAESVAGDDGLDVFDGLASLIDKSLLGQHETGEGEARFTMLETIREYGLDQLASSAEEFEVRSRHASFFAMLAEQAEAEMRGPRQVVWYERLELEHPNLRAALDFCARTPVLLETGLRMGGALWWFWWRRTHQREGIEPLERLITAAGDGEPSVGRAKALCGAGALAFHLGAFEMSRQRLEQSVQVARELGDDALVAVALIHFAWPLTRQDLALARKVTEEGLALLRAAGDSWGVATALNYLGELMRMLGNLSEAVALYEQSVALNREIGNTWVLATSTHNLACTLRRLGDVDRVPALNRETAMAVRQIRSPTLATMVLQDMADTAMQQGDPARATRLVGAATAIYDAIGCVIEGADQIEFDRVTKSARELLSPDAYTRAWTEGTSMTREEAIAFALDEDDGCVRALRTGGSGV